MKKEFVVLFFLLMVCFSSLMAQGDHLDPITLDKSDTTFLYNKKGEKVMMYVRGFDASGKEVMRTNYDILPNGRIINNYMKCYYMEDHKDICVAYYWAVNHWIPCDMQIDDLNEKSLVATSTLYTYSLKSKYSSDIIRGEWLKKFKYEYTYDRNSYCTNLNIYVWKKTLWELSRSQSNLGRNAHNRRSLWQAPVKRYKRKN